MYRVTMRQEQDMSALHILHPNALMQTYTEGSRKVPFHQLPGEFGQRGAPR